MKIQGISTKLLTNKYVLKCLEKVSEHGTSFAATTSLVLSLSLRPAAIMNTPDTEKENKQYAASNSICSGLIKFGMVEAVALPIENAIKKIDKNPQKYLNPETIKKFGGENLTNSRSYKLMTQIAKQSVGFLTAIPKSMLTIALIPVVMDKIFKNSYKGTKFAEIPKTEAETQTGSKTNFTGGGLAKQIGHIIDNKSFQNFAIKHQNKDKDIAKHITAGTDILLTSSAVWQTDRSKKIKEKRKKALIYNNIISTAITIVGGYCVDGMLKNKTGKFIQKFSKANINNPKLPKYIEGINIVRPAIIFAGIYYGILPIFSTYIAEKIDKYIERKSQ